MSRPYITYDIPEVPDGIAEAVSPKNQVALTVLLKPHMQPVGYVELSNGGDPHGYAEDIAPEEQARWATSAARVAAIGLLHYRNFFVSPDYVEGPYTLVVTEDVRGLLDPEDDFEDEDE